MTRAPRSASRCSVLSSAVRFWAAEEDIHRGLYGLAEIDPAARAFVDRQTSGRRSDLQRLSKRLHIGRTVLRRASWPVLATELPAEPQALASWARERGMPRRVFVRSPLQPKPICVDLESPTLLRVLARFLAPVSERAPTAAVVFTEMLPGPDDCWLEDSNGRYTCELRVVAVDTSRRPGGATPAPR